MLAKGRIVVAQTQLTAGNGIYTISVNDDTGSAACGGWTAITASKHPAGAGKDVLFGTGTPMTSNTILRSYTSDNFYVTAQIPGSGCGKKMCVAASQVVTPILFGGKTVGFRSTWTLQDGTNGPRIELAQEVVVVGPVDGRETIDNTVIRETHTVRNLGPGLFSFGLRKQWDWQIGTDTARDDGPYFGSCTSPTVACNRSMELTADGSLNGPYPATYVINQDPGVVGCPSNVTPIDTTGCGGQPPYLVAGTVAPPSSLFPPPTAPELLQYNSWNKLVEDCWRPGLEDAASCGSGGNVSGDDTAVAYFYGLTQQTAINLAPGDQRSFTQYVAAAGEGCPSIVSVPPGNPCCPPWDASRLEDMLFYSGSGGIADPYTLKFVPSNVLQQQMQAYIDYLFALNPAMSAITIHFRVNDAGIGNAPAGGPQVGVDHFISWSHNGPQPSSNFFDLANELLLVNRWYRIHTGIYLENGQSFFPSECANNDVDVRIQVQPHALQPVIQMRWGTGPVMEKRLPVIE